MNFVFMPAIRTTPDSAYTSVHACCGSQSQSPNTTEFCFSTIACFDVQHALVFTVTQYLPWAFAVFAIEKFSDLSTNCRMLAPQIIAITNKIVNPFLACNFFILCFTPLQRVDSTNASSLPSVTPNNFAAFFFCSGAGFQKEPASANTKILEEVTFEVVHTYTYDCIWQQISRS